ncbi:Plastid division protein pdv1, partial [Stylosanthes scabra]|nr:Plastid division protein pdv1 [Stylosanthes scabra]
MKWNMEIEEIEAILEKIWDIHDKLSDAIHSISRSHFLSSVNSLKNSHNIRIGNLSATTTAEDRVGFVFVKDFRPEDDDSALHEAKSLNAIRTALENLEDQLEFLH